MYWAISIFMVFALRCVTSAESNGHSSLSLDTGLRSNSSGIRPRTGIQQPPRRVDSVIAHTKTNRHGSLADSPLTTFLSITTSTSTAPKAKSHIAPQDDRRRQLKGLLGGVAGGLGGVVSNLIGGLQPAVTAALAPIQSAANTNLAQISLIHSLAPQVVPTADVIGPAAAAANPVLGNLLGGLISAISPLVQGVGGVVGGVAAPIETLVGPVESAVAAPIQAAVAPLVSALAPAVAAALAPVGEAVGGVVQPVASNLLAPMESAIAPLLAGVVSAAVGAVGGVEEPIANAIQPLLNGVDAAVLPLASSVVAAVWPAIAPIVTPLNPIVCALQPAEVPVGGDLTALIPVQCVSVTSGNVIPVSTGVATVASLLGRLSSAFTTSVPALNTNGFSVRAVGASPIPGISGIPVPTPTTTITAPLQSNPLGTATGVGTNLPVPGLGSGASSFLNGATALTFITSPGAAAGTASSLLGIGPNQASNALGSALGVVTNPLDSITAAVGSNPLFSNLGSATGLSGSDLTGATNTLSQALGPITGVTTVPGAAASNPLGAAASAASSMLAALGTAATQFGVSIGLPSIPTSAPLLATSTLPLAAVPSPGIGSAFPQSATTFLAALAGSSPGANVSPAGAGSVFSVAGVVSSILSPLPAVIPSTAQFGNIGTTPASPNTEPCWMMSPVPQAGIVSTNAPVIPIVMANPLLSATPLPISVPAAATAYPPAGGTYPTTTSTLTSSPIAPQLGMIMLAYGTQTVTFAATQLPNGGLVASMSGNIYAFPASALGNVQGRKREVNPAQPDYNALALALVSLLQQAGSPLSQPSTPLAIQNKAANMRSGGGTRTSAQSTDYVTPIPPIIDEENSGASFTISSCPDINGTSYISNTGNVYEIVCGTNWVGRDIEPWRTTSNFDDCVAVCDSLNAGARTRPCAAALFVPDAPTSAANCYPKYAVDNPTGITGGYTFQAAVLKSNGNVIDNGVGIPSSHNQATDKPPKDEIEPDAPNSSDRLVSQTVSADSTLSSTRTSSVPLTGPTLDLTSMTSLGGLNVSNDTAAGQLFGTNLNGAPILYATGTQVIEPVISTTLVLGAASNQPASQFLAMTTNTPAATLFRRERWNLDEQRRQTAEKVMAGGPSTRSVVPQDEASAAPSPPPHLAVVETVTRGWRGDASLSSLNHHQDRVGVGSGIVGDSSSLEMLRNRPIFRNGWGLESVSSSSPPSTTPHLWGRGTKTRPYHERAAFWNSFEEEIQSDTLLSGQRRHDNRRDLALTDFFGARRLQSSTTDVTTAAKTNNAGRLASSSIAHLETSGGALEETIAMDKRSGLKGRSSRDRPGDPNAYDPISNSTGADFALANNPIDSSTGIASADGIEQPSLTNLSNVPHFSRDGGKGGMVGSQHVFIFADTGVYTTESDGTNGYFLGYSSSSVAVDFGHHGLYGNSLILKDGVGEFSDSQGRLRGFAPLTIGETGWNAQAAAAGVASRYAIWPESSFIPLTANESIMYAPIVYDVTDNVTQSAEFTYTGNTLLSVSIDETGQPVAERTANRLFNASDPEWGCVGGIRSWGVDGVGGSEGRVYVFGNVRGGLLMARTSASKVADTGSYEYWSGSAWTTGPLAPDSMAYVLEGSFMDIDIFFSARHLTFIAVYTNIYGDNTVYWKYLRAPQAIVPGYAGGDPEADIVESLTKYEWSDEHVLFKMGPGLNGQYSYAMGVHLGYFGQSDISNGGEKMLLSWTSPTGQDAASRNSAFQIMNGVVNWQ